MKFFPLLALSLASSLSLGAAVLTLGPSTQIVTQTGTGLNADRVGTSRLTWGNCNFDGTTTTCIVSGRYTRPGAPGGTYVFTLTYPGNGPSPLGAVASPPGSNLVYYTLTAGNFGFVATPDGGEPVTFYDPTFNLFFDQSAVCGGVASCAVGAVGASTGGTIAGPLNGQYDVTPVIAKPTGVVTAAAFGASTSIAPGTWIEIYGTNLATTLSRTWAGGDFDGVKAPTSLGGTTVTVGGKAAFVDFVSPGQVNAQVPSGLSPGPQPIVVTTAGGPSLAATVTLNTVEPGILAPPVFKLAAGQYAVAIFPDGITYALPPGTTNNVPTARAKPGNTITLYGVGFGTVTPNIDAGLIVQQTNALPNFQASFAGVPATVQFAGLVQGLLGLYQFNVVVPNVAAGDAVPFTFSVNGTAGKQTLLVPIGN